MNTASVLACSLTLGLIAAETAVDPAPTGTDAGPADDADTSDGGSPDAEATTTLAPDVAPVAPDVSGVDPARRDLVEGVRWLEAVEPERALEALQRAAEAGPYALDDVVTLHHHLGIARAYLGDEQGAVVEFQRLLAVAPGHSLDYTTSPRATFLFQRAVDTAKDKRSIELSLATEPVVALDRPIRIQLTAVADPLGVVTRVALLHRRKGDPTFQRVEMARPPLGTTKTIELPALPASEARADEQGLVGGLLEVAVIGYDERDWEVYVAPAPSRPLEVPVGYQAPIPWYGHWWLWGIVGGVAVAGVATAGAVGIAWALPPPPTIPADYRVEVTP